MVLFEINLELLDTLIVARNVHLKTDYIRFRVLAVISSLPKESQNEQVDQTMEIYASGL